MYTAVSEQLARDSSARLIMHLFMKLRFKFKKEKNESRGVASQRVRGPRAPVCGAASTASKGSC